jgi:hypothetical protein
MTLGPHGIPPCVQLPYVRSRGARLQSLHIRRSGYPNSGHTQSIVRLDVRFVKFRGAYVRLSVVRLRHEAANANMKPSFVPVTEVRHEEAAFGDVRESLLKLW